MKRQKNTYKKNTRKKKHNIFHKHAFCSFDKSDKKFSKKTWKERERWKNIKNANEQQRIPLLFCVFYSFSWWHIVFSWKAFNVQMFSFLLSFFTDVGFDAEIFPFSQTKQNKNLFWIFENYYYCHMSVLECCKKVIHFYVAIYAVITLVRDCCITNMNMNANEFGFATFWDEQTRWKSNYDEIVCMICAFFLSHKTINWNWIFTVKFLKSI